MKTLRVILLPILSILSPGMIRAQTTVNFNHTGGMQTFNVPTGVTQLIVDVRGAQGGTGNGSAPGLGGRAQAVVPVTPGESLQIHVGGQGQSGIGLNLANASGGYNGGGYGGYDNSGQIQTGGGGGGASDIRRTSSLNNRIIVAGGGGGAAAGASTNGPGGSGGGTNGGTGGYNGSAVGGGGGSQSAGGAAYSARGATAGTFGTGGNGSTNRNAWGSGGGGGGWYGGGGGSGTADHPSGYSGAGGGGSGYAHPTASGVTMSSGTQSGNGFISITYTQPPSDNANLSSLSLSSGSLSPAFTSGTTAYAASVPNATSSITVTPIVQDSSSTMKVNNVSVASGSPSAAIHLNIGSNTITTVVTAGDGTTTKTYTVTVTRLAVGNHLLVSDGVSRSILRLDATTGAATTFIGASNFNGDPQGMAIGPDGYLYVLDTNFSTSACRVLKFNTQTGAFIGIFASTGLSSGYFLAFDSSGNLYVLRDSSPLVVKFSSAGALIGNLVNTGHYAGSTNAVSATGMNIGPDGRIYLCVNDGFSTGDIVRFDTNGNFLDTFVNNVGNSNGHRKPIWDAQGNFWACNLNDGVIRKFNGTNGVLMQSIDPPTNGYVGMGFTPDGDLLVGAVWNNTIYRTKTEGTLLGSFATNIQAMDIIQQPGVFPEIAVERPVGTNLSDAASIVEFGRVIIGSSGPAVTFTIRNNGTEDLVLGAIAKDGANPGDFTVSTPGTTTISAGSMTNFTVSFAPGAAGPRNASIHIPSNVSGSRNPFDINLTGSGNTAPTFAGYPVSTPWQTAASISQGKLLTAASDADSDALSVTAAGPTSAQGGTVVLGSSILYTPPAAFSGTDTFSVTIADAYGATVSGTVTVSVGPNPTSGGVGVNPPQITMPGNGTALIGSQGIPGRTYMVQRSTNLSNWTNIGTVVAASNGTVSFIDPNPPVGSAFYRLGRNVPEMNFWGNGSDGSLTTAGNISFGSTQDGDVVVKQFTNLTINTGHTVTTSNRCRGLVIYVNGDCTINGTLSMTARGANVDPSQPNSIASTGIRLARYKYGVNETLAASDLGGTGLGGVGAAWRSAEANQLGISGTGRIYTIAREGGAGGAARFVPDGGSALGALTGGTAANGTGGGASGGSAHGLSGAGSAGTCYSGGSGGGGANGPASIVAGSGAPNGGSGGIGAYHATIGTGGGAGNPGGAGYSPGGAGSNGTGGLLILLVRGNLVVGSSGSIRSEGSPGGYHYSAAAGGGSGGGRLLVLYAGNLTQLGTFSTIGQLGSGGALGGTGAFTIDRIDP